MEAEPAHDALEAAVRAGDAASGHAEKAKSLRAIQRAAAAGVPVENLLARFATWSEALKECPWRGSWRAHSSRAWSERV
jgi:hypothetical protein